jgi:ketosteroid isomerase-like protein
MKSGQLDFLGFLAVALVVGRPSLSAGAALDQAAAEAAVRSTDADWAAATSTASVDAWVAFYAADAIARLPDDRVASGGELLRRNVSRLLARPHLSIAWRPIKVEVAESGDLAFLTGAYELRFGDSRGAQGSDRGRRLEIWRKRADGNWRCIVDAWNLDESITAPSVAAPANAQGTAQAAGSAEPLVQAERPTPTAVPESLPPTAPRAEAVKYGDMPAGYQEAIRKYFLEHLKHPDSVQYREITQPEQGYMTAVTGTFFMSEKREYGWMVKATINAKNSKDGYVGFKTYTFLFRGEKIVDARSPLPGDEMN